MPSVVEEIKDPAEFLSQLHEVDRLLVQAEETLKAAEHLAAHLIFAAPASFPTSSYVLGHALQGLTDYIRGEDGCEFDFEYARRSLDQIIAVAGGADA